MDFEQSIRGNKARENFNSGYNCSQSVLLAYEDYLQEKGLDPKTVLRMASPMGGGISRLREICGAVSSLCLLIGILRFKNLHFSSKSIKAPLSAVSC